MIKSTEAINPTIKSFKDLLLIVQDHQIEKESLLPITHIPKSWKLPVITTDRVLRANRDNKYFEDENLVFFYYGRNVYKSSDKKYLQNDPFSPVLLVFRLIDIRDKSPIRLLPFDSGGFSMYKLHEELSPKHFEIINPSHNDIKKLVVVLFKDNNNYVNYNHDFKDLFNKLPFLLQIQELHKLYEEQSNQRTSIGKQAKSFEIQYDVDVPLAPYLVLIPHNFYTDDGGRRQFENEFQMAKIIPYKNTGNPDADINCINEALLNEITKDK